MIKAFKLAYARGYRAGGAGARHTLNPFKGKFIRAICWDLGWHDGTVKYLNHWLKQRREKRNAG